ncbi:MAG: ABC transporter ATP-binding protein [Planctomycetaceae bacterium]
MIELREVTMEAGAFTLRDLSMVVPTSRYAALMGRTGQGKTTLLEAICGLRRVSGGRVLIDGTDVTDWSPGDRGIGYVPQDLALFPTLTVSEQLAFALRLRNRPADEVSKRVRDLAEMLGIGHLLGRRVTHLSGGESQRVALGRALSFRPTVVLLDEPLSALDEATRGDMHELLRQVQRAHRITVLHVTHSSAEADALADCRFLIEGGAIVQAKDVSLEG